MSEEIPMQRGETADDLEIAAFARTYEAVVGNVEKVIQGKGDKVRLATLCLFAEGHLLIEDVPGVGKTLLARCLAGSLAAPWRRIQFTPDLLPSDITGSTVYDSREHAFEFRPGPVFANIVLADEINRASPKAQSALLEVMAERQVTVDTESRLLEPPFMVVATQNPVEMRGTFPLPEAQLDRFLMRITLDYPDRPAETRILRDVRQGRRVEDLRPVVSAAEVVGLIDVARRVVVVDTVEDYIVRVVAATRDRPELRLGGSPRGSVALMRAAQVVAAAQNRGYVTPEDVKAIAVPVLAHRLVLTADAELRGTTVQDVMADVLDAVDVPRSLRVGA